MQMNEKKIWFRGALILRIACFEKAEECHFITLYYQIGKKQLLFEIEPLAPQNPSKDWDRMSAWHPENFVILNKWMCQSV